MPRRIAALTCIALCAAGVLGVAGCSGLRTITAEVQATALAAGTTSSSAAASPPGPALGPGARYRHERLPSQAENPAQAEAIEALADAALQAAGLVRDEQQARYSAQVQIGIESFHVDEWGRRAPGMPPYSPAYFGELGVHIGPGRVGPGTRIGRGWTSWPPTVHYAYGVSLLLRDLQSQRIVYETHARHLGPWGDRERVLPALLSAALRDFPAPQSGTVQIQLPR
jgi:hypothetical protein